MGRKQRAEKIFIPLALKTKDPLLYEMAHLAHDQETADSFIRIAMPGFCRTQKIQKPPPDKSDMRAASEYSLECCQGGAKYHRVQPDKRRTQIIDE